MKKRSTAKIFVWAIPGLLLFGLFVGAALHYRQDSNPTLQLASKATRVDLVSQMQVALESESEAEKSAVLAITDQDSKKFADLARAATAEVSAREQQLRALLNTRSNQHEMELLAQFSAAFGELRRVDDEVLDLAIKNTNLKAYSVLFGPSADTLTQMEAALARVLAKHADKADAKRATDLALGARIAVLHIQTLLAPHIAEESDTKMDQMEVAMAQQEVQTGKDLDALAAMAEPEADADVKTAASSFQRYRELKAQILALSRENTNVRSLTLSLNQKRNATSLCLDALNSLKQAILEEPIAGVNYGRLPKPR